MKSNCSICKMPRVKYADTVIKIEMTNFDELIHILRFYVNCWGDVIKHKLEEHSMGCSFFSLCSSSHKQYEVSKVGEIMNAKANPF
jgi:hypothetical protein